MLAKKLYDLRGRDLSELGATFVPFTAQTRMSGADLDGREIRKGAADAVEAFVTAAERLLPVEVEPAVQNVAKQGGTPLVVADGGGCSEWSSSRTSSRAASGSASTICAAWASARS